LSITYKVALRRASLAMLGLALALPLAAAPKKAAAPAKTAPAKASAAAKGTYVLLDTTKGKVTVELFTKQSPATAANFLKLVRSGFYSGIMFHRVEPGFVVQAGDPQSKTLPPGDPMLGRGGPGYTIKMEASATKLKHEMGTLSMARKSNDVDSAGSQFFICLKAVPFLDGGYAVFGKVAKGMDVVEKLKVGDRIKKATVVPKP
jgi:cyclophilin family peptidyl-prolyl cis-trans isomerase